MKIRLITMLAPMIVAMAASAPAVFAQESDTSPKWGCPAPFELHMAHEHDHEGEHPHKHVGTDTDKNQDGWICVKHVGKDGAVHVHTDNHLPL